MMKVQSISEQNFGEKKTLESEDFVGERKTLRKLDKWSTSNEMSQLFRFNYNPSSAVWIDSHFFASSLLMTQSQITTE